MIFVSVRFYVKSILRIRQVQNQPFYYIQSRLARFPAEQEMNLRENSRGKWLRETAGKISRIWQNVWLKLNQNWSIIGPFQDTIQCTYETNHYHCGRGILKHFYSFPNSFNLLPTTFCLVLLLQLNLFLHFPQDFSQSNLEALNFDFFF